MTIGQRIKRARILNGYTQQQLADRTDFDISSISLIERDERGLTASKLKLICECLGISADELLDIKTDYKLHQRVKDRLAGLEREIAIIKQYFK